jgi:hypothetical protein
MEALAERMGRTLNELTARAGVPLEDGVYVRERRGS